MRTTVGWLLVGVSVAALLTGIIIGLGAGTELTAILWIFIGPVPFLAAGAYLLWRDPENPTSFRLVAVATLSFALSVPLEAGTVAAYRANGPADWMWLPLTAHDLLGIAGTIVATWTVALLVDGHIHALRERRYLHLLWGLLLLVPLMLVTNPFVYHQDIAFSGVDGIPSPFFVPGLASLGGPAVGLYEASYLVFLGGIVLLVMRYRDAPFSVQRRLRWVLFGGVMAIAFGLWPFVLGALDVLPSLFHGPLAGLFFLPILMLPVSIVIAVDEPDWIDVDFVVNKTFVYGVLTFLILLLYVAFAAFSGIVAESRLSVEVAIIVTVAVAIAFQPARRWLQRKADRWVFGDRPTSYEAVRDFTSSLGGTDDPTELLGLMADLIVRAVGARWVCIDLTDGATAREGSPEGDAVLEVPMNFADEQYGSIRCGAKTDGRFSDEDQRLIHTLAAQGALAISNSQLAGRLVDAQEAERRRIERNIHDGAQQELVALVARLGMARHQLQEGELHPADVDELRREATRILAELRELAQGIHPSVLSDGGLLEAVEDRCGRLPIEVRLDAPESLRNQRFSDNIEGAAYFFITESLTNVLKHSDATSARVGIERTNGVLSMRVSDNGCGFDAGHTAEHGLAGLRDRVAALGGTMTVATATGSGTTLSATFPVGP